jgi:ribosomal protein S12 methylthiotransferase accessory factor YcaO
MSMSSQVWHLKTQKKWTMNGTSRIQPAHQTLEKIIPLAKMIGVTRLADITNMDVLRIPNYSAVLPGTEDYIWVYSGKGPTKAHAMASALMEAIERFSALPSTAPRNLIQGSYEKLCVDNDVLHPDEIFEPVRFQYRNDMQMDFMAGVELFTGKEILVPASLALFRYTPKFPSVNPFAYHHTNGLASGNVIEEAICHSLCEVIERDAMSLAELRASAIPFHCLRHITNSLRSNGYAVATIPLDRFKDDTSIFPDVDTSEIEYEPIVAVLRKFGEANISLIIKDITSELGIPTFNAASVEWISHNYGYLAEGHGTHPDARIALLRAITEVSQTRAANIQGARDDLRKIKYGEDNTDDKRSWQFLPSEKKIRFSEIRSFLNDDIQDDIKLILEKLRGSGLTRAIIVNLTNERIRIPVVRAIVPGLETFKITKSIIGWRAKKYFKK